MTSEYVIGVDLGQANDYTAIAVLQKAARLTGRDERRVTSSWHGFTTTIHPQAESVYQVRHLERLPLGTPYPRQVERVAQVIDQVKRLTDTGSARFPTSAPRLAVDQTGVGRPVVDMLRQAGMKRVHAISITAGDTVTREGMEFRVPKRELVSVLQVLLQTERLAVASALPEAETLIKEMLAFKVTISSAGHDSYGNDWRENDHDDLVLAVALAAWVGETLSGVTRLEPIGLGG